MYIKKYFFAFSSLVIASLAMSCSSGSDSPAPTPTPPPVVIPPPVVETPTPITGKTFYVDASVATSGTGLTEATAFKTLAEAALATGPGDGVLVKNGTYTNFEETSSGTASGWIVWRNFPGHKPLISFSSWQGFYVKGSYIEIDGFEIKGSNQSLTLADALKQGRSCQNPSGSLESKYNSNGIQIDGRVSANNPSGTKFHHLNVKNCDIHDCGGSGIQTIQSDYITIVNNKIYNNAWYSIYAPSGISVYQCWNSDSNTSVNKVVIRNNFIYNNKMLVPWPSASCKFTDGNGIIIDDNKNTQSGSTLGEYLGKTLIENNVVYENGGRGIHLYIADNVTVVNNTCYNNCSTAEISEGEITSIGKNATLKNKNNSVYNNIMFARAGEKVNTVSDSENYTQNNNIFFNSDSGNFGAADGKVDPKFIDAAGGNFKIATDSKAIDYGSRAAYFPARDILGIARFIGTSVDCGAYEVK
jgi:parallel beta-helix repeat protein